MDRVPFLVVCCGNADRGDDAVGPLVAEMLQLAGVPVRRSSGNALDLLSDFDDARALVLVDAVVAGHPVGTILSWNVNTERVPARKVACSTHWVGVAEAIELARILGKLPEVCVLYGIEAGQFEPGAGQSPEVLASVDELAQRIMSERAILESACVSQSLAG